MILPFPFTKDMGEFFTIQLVGGGAGGGPHKGGGAGESKVVHYPGLEGTYVIKLGAGGAANRNGGITAIYRKNYVGQDNGATITTNTLVEFAKGGTWTNESIDTTLDIDEQEKLKEGEVPAFSETSGTGTSCGQGGRANLPGQSGEVVIRW